MITDVSELYELDDTAFNRAAIFDLGDRAAVRVTRIVRHSAVAVRKDTQVHIGLIDPLQRGVVLNPGRPGCRAEVLDAILAARPGRVAYLSCNPETLARDLARLVAGGLGLDGVVPFDFMPQTDQVEALALLA